jgi:hypothetical protein
MFGRFSIPRGLGAGKLRMTERVGTQTGKILLLEIFKNLDFSRGWFDGELKIKLSLDDKFYLVLA